MENKLAVMELLGEDNVKKLQDNITDILLEQVRSDLEDKYRYDYILAFEDIYEEVKELIEEEFKDKLMEIYREKMDNFIEALLDKKE